MTAAEYLPPGRSLSVLEKAATHCKGCELFKRATQTVFGEGSETAEMFFVGEQPGDQEDRQGRPFVGPAGRLLDETLEAVGVDRGNIYITNAVKHFKWEPRGKRRLHKKPSVRELAACRPWLDAEIEAIQPRIIVCLGATAAQSLLGREFRITRQHGELLEFEARRHILATWHPSAVLRVPDSTARKTKREELIADLRMAATVLT